MGVDYHLYQNIKDEQSLEKAFQKAEQNKSILLKDAIKGERGYTLANIPDYLFVKQQQLQKQLATVQRKKIQANTTEQKRVLQASENEILLSIEDFKTSLLQEYPEYHALQYDQKEVSLSTIQEDLKEEDLLIEYLVGDSMTYVFGITREKTTMVALNVSRKTLHYRTKLFRQSLSNYQFLVNDKKKAYAQYTEQAHWFYTNFLAKLLEQIEEDKKHLILVTDDELGHLPFETFLTTSGEQQAYEKLPYLVNQYSISYIYSAMLWQENNRIDASLNNHQLLGLASSYEALDTARLDSLRSGTIAGIRELLEPLSAVSEEVASLEQQFEGRFLAGQEVTEQFFKENATEYSVLHLAMHGILNKEKPLFSSLAFTEDYHPVEDNFVHGYEISQLSLKADLVVLSACETGYGKFQQGQGVLSLARSFMSAGVPAVVVSLWQVNDQTTAIIMQYFYQNLAKGMTKSTALQQAKVDYLQQATGLAAHPAYWSAFVQIGNDRPIQLEQRGGWKWYIMGGGLCIILLVGGLYRFKTKDNV